MLGHLSAIFLCAAFLGAGAAGAQTAAEDTSAAPQEMRAPAPSDTAAPTAPDTAAPKASAAATAPAKGGGVVVYGRTTLSNGMPLPEVTADLFVAGLEAATATTDADGVFSMSCALEGTADETVVMWFTPPPGLGLVREIVVLKESKAAVEVRLYGPCVTRVPLGDSTRVDVQVLDQQSYAARIEESGCMDLMKEEIPEYNPKYELSVGSTFSLVTSSSNRFSQQFGGTEMAVTSRSAVTYFAQVDSVTSDGMVLSLEYRDRKLTTDNPEATGSVDFAPLLGKKVSALLSPQGGLSRFAGFDALPEIAMGAGETVDRERYVSELKQVFPTLAAGAVSPGDKWTGEQIVKEPMGAEGSTSVTVSTTYTLVGETVVRGVDCLEIDSQFIVSVKGQGVTQGSPFSLKMNGSGTAKIYFAHGRGMLLEMSGKSSTEGTIESMGMNIPVKSEDETKVEVTLQ